MSADRAKALNTLLAAGQMCRVQFLPSFPGVVVPHNLAKEPAVGLELGYNLPVPILDLNVDADAITGTFSFGRRPCLVVIPWGAVGWHGTAWDWSKLCEKLLEDARKLERAKHPAPVGMRPGLAEGATSGRTGSSGTIVPPAPRKPARELPPYLRVVK